MKAIVLTGKQEKSFYKEAKLFLELDCNFVIKCFRQFVNKDRLHRTGYLILEYCQVQYQGTISNLYIKTLRNKIFI